MRPKPGPLTLKKFWLLPKKLLTSYEVKILKKVSLSKFSGELQSFSRTSLDKKRKAVLAGIAKSIPDLVGASPVDTGAYASSWGFTADEHSAFIGNYAPYAGVIEHGARPHTMPIAPLLAWAKRVLGSSSQPPDYEPRVWALAKGVQNKIAQFGQAPKHILENMIPKIIENIRLELKNA
jgi:hypothetical protein